MGLGRVDCCWRVPDFGGLCGSVCLPGEFCWLVWGGWVVGVFLIALCLICGVLLFVVVVLGYFLGFSLLLGLYNIVPLGGRVLGFGVDAGIWVS